MRVLYILLIFSLIWVFNLFNQPVFSLTGIYRDLYFAAVIFLVTAAFRNFRASSFRPRLFEYAMTSLAVIVSYFIIFPFLNNDLVSDQFYHSEYAIKPFVKSASDFCASTEGPPRCLDQSFSYYIDRQLSVFLFIVVLTGYVLFRTDPFIFRFLISIGFYFFSVYYIKSNDWSFSDIHPPFRLFPIAVSASVFGISNFAFRFAEFAGLILLYFYSISLLRKTFRFTDAVILSAAVVSIPLILHTSYIVEPSVWTCTAWTGMLLFIFYGDRTDRSFLLWYSVLTLASLMRASAFAGMIPLSIHWLIVKLQGRNLKRIFTFSSLKVFLPVLIMLPYTLAAVLAGSPATGGGLGLSASLKKSLVDGLSLRFAYQAVSLPWFFFFPASLFFFERKKIFYIPLIILFFGIGYIMFYSINPVLWGLGRYQAEFIIPFVCLGMVNFYLILWRKEREIIRIIFLAMIIWSFYKTSVYQSYSTIEDEFAFVGVQKFKIEGLSEIVYDTSDPLKKLKRDGMASTVYIEGITYGFLPNILAGYGYKELKSVSAVGFPWGGFGAEGIHAKRDIKAVIISDWGSGKLKKEQLQKKGWVLDSVYKNLYYQTETFLLKREQYAEENKK